MPNIEIFTAQNVPIEYELAGLRDRCLAFLLDFTIISAVLIILLIGLAFAGVGETLMIYTVYFVFIPIFFFYSLAMEIFNDGQSVGKLALKIKVVRLSGDEVTPNDYIVRWMFRMIDIYFSFGSIASMLVGSSEKGQRMGDIVANTTVVRLQPRHQMALTDLLKIGTTENYQVKFQDARKLNEDDMLLLKQVLERHQRFENDAHKQAVITIANNIAMQLNLEKTPVNKIDFLKTVLRDYVVLTR
jgi:uncharacterized RDD family membrane protein YckC